MLSLIIRAFFLITLFCVVTTAHAQDAKAVRVTGQGATQFEARQDAIRQALQISVDQLIIEQRVVQNDNLVLDKISSTMNGFVSNFDTLSVSESSSGFSIEAEIQVSRSRIQNFIGSSSGANATINSQNILAASQQERLARRARADLLAALFSELEFALIASAPQVDINKSNPDKVDLSFTVSIDPVFIATLRSGLREISDYHLSAADLAREHGRDDVKYNFDKWLRQLSEADPAGPGASLTVCLTGSIRNQRMYDSVDEMWNDDCFIMYSLDKDELHPMSATIAAAAVVYANGTPLKFLNAIDMRSHMLWGILEPSNDLHHVFIDHDWQDNVRIFVYTGRASIQGTFDVASLENISDIKIFPFLVSDRFVGRLHNFRRFPTNVIQGIGFENLDPTGAFFETFKREILKMPPEDADQLPDNSL